MDHETRVAQMTWQLGNLLTDKQLRRLVPFSSLPAKDRQGTLDLDMRLAVLKAEIGHPLEQRDWKWITRYTDRGHRIQAFEAAKQSKFRSPILTRAEVAELPTITLHRPRKAGLRAIAVSKVLQQNHSCVFQDESGTHYAIQYGGGILFTNYSVGTQFWLEGGLRTGSRIIRLSGEQKSVIIAIAKLNN